MPAGAQRRKHDYAALDDVGYDMVDALRAQKNTIADLSSRFGVTEFNLTLWLRRQRTLIWLEQASPESIVDLLATGETAASIARAHEIQLFLVERWIHDNIPAEHLSDARNCSAEAMFDKDMNEINHAGDEMALARVKARHSIGRFHAVATTRRFTDDKTVKVTPGEGLSVSFSFTRKRRETGEVEADDTGAEKF
jgi:hypothetical protein